MPKLDLPVFHNENPSFTDLKFYTKGFSVPALIKGVMAGHPCFAKWTIDYFRRETEGLTKIVGTYHAASYWAKNPLAREYGSLCSSVDAASFFSEKPKESLPGRYYIARLRYQQGEYLSNRPIPLNELDKLFIKDIPKLNFLPDTSMSLVWISRGGTLSSLHSDPLHNTLFQVKGNKRVFIVPDRQRFSGLRNKLTPHLLHIRDPYDHEDRHYKKLMALDYHEVELTEGDMLVLPVWCYHHVESCADSLNITITNHFVPSRQFLFLSSTARAAWFARRIYPKIVRKKRNQFLLNRLSPDAIPFFPKDVQFLSQSAKVPCWNSDATHYLIKKRTRNCFPLSDAEVICFLQAVDGRSSISQIAISTSCTLDDALSIVRELIALETIGIYFNSDQDALNYNNHLAEVS